jgi:hypothetical protein
MNYLVTVVSTTGVATVSTNVESTVATVESVVDTSVEAPPHATNVAIAKIAITFLIM